MKIDWIQLYLDSLDQNIPKMGLDKIKMETILYLCYSHKVSDRTQVQIQ